MIETSSVPPWKSLATFGNLRNDIGNPRKSSESGRKSSESRQEHCYCSMFI